MTAEKTEVINRYNTQKTSVGRLTNGGSVIIWFMPPKYYRFGTVSIANSAGLAIGSMLTYSVVLFSSLI